MLLHEIKIKNVGTAKHPRIGRGGKRGHTSGKGQKGQKSRSGHRIRPAERDLLIRIPKLRGYQYKSIYERTQVVNLRDINAKKITEVTPKNLYDAGLIRNMKKPIKILGRGMTGKNINAKNVTMSKKARVEIQSAKNTLS